MNIKEKSLVKQESETRKTNSYWQIPYPITKFDMGSFYRSFMQTKCPIAFFQKRNKEERKQKKEKEELIDA